jgi:hypothetical protein
MRLIAFILALFAPAARLPLEAGPNTAIPTTPSRSHSRPNPASKPRSSSRRRPLAAGAGLFRCPNSAFKMTIVDLAKAGLESAVIDHAIKTLSKGGEIKLDIPHRISRVFGRQLSIQAADGSRSSVAVFYHDQRLYQIEGKAQANGNTTADAIRFQQSLVFTDSD